MRAKVLSYNTSFGSTMMKFVTSWSWVLRTMKEDVFNMIFGVNMIYEVWTCLKEKLLLDTIKKRYEKYVDD